MKFIELFLRGIAAGLAISVPVGPVNVFCISRTLANGRKAGLISGLGAATADTLYGGIAAFSISMIIGFLVRQEFWIRLFGGILLIGIGIVYYRKQPHLPESKEDSPESDYAGALLLNLTNPTTVLSFLAVLAGLGLGQPRPWSLTLAVLAGILVGAMLWWVTLALVAGRFRDRFNDRTMLWMNRVAGLAIGGFGVVTLILSRSHLK